MLFWNAEVTFVCKQVILFSVTGRVDDPLTQVYVHFYSVRPMFLTR